MTPIKDEDVSMETLYKTMEYWLGTNKEYSTTNVVDMTHITRQPLRILQDIINPRSEGPESKKQYFFTQEEVVLVQLAKMANDIGFKYDKKESDKEDSDKEETIKEIFLKFNSNIQDIAGYLLESDNFSKYIGEMENVASNLILLNKFAPEKAFLWQRSVEKYKSNEQLLTKKAPKKKSPFKMDDVIEIDDFYRFIKNVPEITSLKKAKNKNRIMDRLEELVKKEFAEENIDNTMEYLLSLEDRPDEEDFHSYIIIAKIGGVSNFDKMCKWITTWQLRRLSQNLRQGLYKENINQYIKTAQDALQEHFLEMIFLPETDSFVTDINDLLGEDAFENIRKLACYSFLTIARLSKTFTDSFEFLEDKLTAQNLSDISLNDIREGGKELYEICSQIFDTDMKDDLGAIFLNVDNSFFWSQAELDGVTDMLSSAGEEALTIVVHFFNEIGEAIVKDCPDERMFINAYTKLINDCIFLEEQEGSKEQ